MDGAVLPGRRGRPPMPASLGPKGVSRHHTFRVISSVAGSAKAAGAAAERPLTVRTQLASRQVPRPVRKEIQSGPDRARRYGLSPCVDRSQPWLHIGGLPVPRTKRSEHTGMAPRAQASMTYRGYRCRDAAPTARLASEPVPGCWYADTAVVPAARGAGPSSCRQHVILGFTLA
jgi:hypothetical protein